MSEKQGMFFSIGGRRNIVSPHNQIEGGLQRTYHVHETIHLIGQDLIFTGDGAKILSITITISR